MDYLHTICPMPKNTVREILLSVPPNVQNIHSQLHQVDYFDFHQVLVQAPSHHLRLNDKDKYLGQEYGRVKKHKKQQKYTNIFKSLNIKTYYSKPPQTKESHIINKRIILAPYQSELFSELYLQTINSLNYV